MFCPNTLSRILKKEQIFKPKILRFYTICSSYLLKFLAFKSTISPFFIQFLSMELLSCHIHINYKTSFQTSQFTNIFILFVLELYNYCYQNYKTTIQKLKSYKLKTFQKSRKTLKKYYIIIISLISLKLFTTNW